MSEHRFNVFGRIIAISRQQGTWIAFDLGSEGKRRPADFVVPDFLAEDELCQYLEDLFHETAMPWNGSVFRISPS
ncbi:hypothetical protein SRS16P2_00360 (plasmid) [Variovorax sp. SRS16]|uniref:DUF7661 family protein n=1 Tax=Variovorax sp. SRS16 TaxID=282217 RepID=UPI0013184131|nr:hypothetical protein [Variovorax sp. SRS16]VTU45856.1 hypothetical protein SRS16P2_00360 [Variovorax sp. SRS16]